jgi:hypothetical protein
MARLASGWWSLSTSNKKTVLSGDGDQHRRLPRRPRIHKFPLKKRTRIDQGGCGARPAAKRDDLKEEEQRASP